MVFRYVSVEDERPDLLGKWLSLRAKIYADAGFIAAFEQDSPYRDRYDAYAEHVLVFDSREDEPVGTFRLINGGLGSLPISDEFGSRSSPKARELSGFAIAPPYRKSHATFGAYWLAYQRALAEGVEDVYAILEKPLLHNLLDLGLPVRVLGKEKYLYNTWNIPVTIRPNECVNALREGDARRGNTTRFAMQIQKTWTGTLDVCDLATSSSVTC